MKRNGIYLLSILTLLACGGYVQASSLQLVPSTSIGYIRMANIGKTIDTIDKLIHEIDPPSAQRGQSLAQALGQAIGNNAIKTKQQLEAETGIRMDGDLIVFWPTGNFLSRAYAYPVSDKERVLAKIKSQKGAPREPVPEYSGVELYIFSRGGQKQMNPAVPAQECVFFIGDYLVSCSDEATARLIINSFEGKSSAITSNEKYQNVIKSLRDNEITAFCDLDAVVKMTMPMVQMFGGMAVQGMLSSQATMNTQMGGVGQMPQDAQEQMQNAASAMMKLVMWSLNQLESSGMSLHLGEKGLLVDYFIGFKKESVLQDLLVYKKDKLEMLEYLPADAVIASDAKFNPDAIIKLYTRLLDNIEPGMLSLESQQIDFAEWKSSVINEVKNSFSYYGDEMAIALIPSSGKLPLEIIEIFEVKDSKRAAKGYQDQVNLLNLFQPVWRGMMKNQGDTFAKPKVVENTTYRGVKITGVMFNASQLNMTMGGNDELLKNLESTLWYAVTKDKQIICLSDTDELVKQVIDRLSKRKNDSLRRTSSFKAAVRNLPDNPDSVSFIAVIAYMKSIYSFVKPLQQQQCFSTMRAIENGAAGYAKQLGKFPSSLNDLYNMRLLNRSQVRGSGGDKYDLDKTSGKVVCETHGSLVNPIPLNNINDKFTEVMSYWQGEVDGIGLSSKNQNGGISQSMDTPVEVFNSLAKMIRRMAAAKKNRQQAPNTK